MFLLKPFDRAPYHVQRRRDHQVPRLPRGTSSIVVTWQHLIALPRVLQAAARQRAEAHLPALVRVLAQEQAAA